MLAEAPAVVRRILRLAMLPGLYLKLLLQKQCAVPAHRLTFDLLYIFFRLRYFPDNYGPCRLWEKKRSEWSYYYGSTYHPNARRLLRRNAQRRQYEIVFNDKSVTEQFCKSLAIPIPKSFGMLTATCDVPNRIDQAFQASGESRLIIKPIFGRAGMGICVAERAGAETVIHGPRGPQRLEQFSVSEPCLIQEVINQHTLLRSVAPTSLNTLRVVTFFPLHSQPLVVSALIRFGVGAAYIDNWSAGGLAVGIDLSSGQLQEFAYDKLGNQYRRHPTSGVEFLGYRVPHWHSVIEAAITVQRACPFYRLIGIDICVTDDGPLLVEINANPDIIMQEQTSGPLLKNRQFYDAFRNEGLLFNSAQKALYGCIDA